MTDLSVIRVQWTGLKGMPGVSTFYADTNPGNVMNALKSFFDTVKGYLPAGITLTYPSSGLVVDSTSKQIVNSWTATAPAVTVSSGTGAYAAPCGAVVNWRTGSYYNGREVRGKTFLVPLTGGSYDSDGTFWNATISTLRTAASAVPVAAPEMVVWARSSGIVRPVVKADMPDKVVVLRSRRD